MHELGTYRLFASFPSGSNEWIVVLRNVQMQDVLIRKVLLALRAPVGMHLPIVYIVLLVRGKAHWIVRRKQALHDCGLLRYDCMYKFYVGRLLARDRAVGVF